LWLPGSTPPAPKPLVCGDLDVSPGFCHPFPNDFFAPDPFRHVFGPCGPKPTGFAEKRFLINEQSSFGRGQSNILRSQVKDFADWLKGQGAI